MKNPFDIIVPAAGVGSRMTKSLALSSPDKVHDSIPKQYLPLLGVAILERTLAKLVSLNPRTICLVVARDDTAWQNLPSAAACEIAIGGQTRAESVEAGLDALNAEDESLVLVHDAVRPLFDSADVAQLVSQTLGSSTGGLLATPVVDTLKLANAEGCSEQTPDRSNYWQAQTPQAFSAGLLRSALKYAKTQEIDLTDEASAVEAMGIFPRLIQGSKNNLKITSAEDLALAEFLLSQEAAQ